MAEVVFPHEPRHLFVVHRQTTPAKFRRGPPIAISTPMRQRDRLLAHHWSALFGPVVVDRHVGVDGVDIVLPGEREQTSGGSYQ